jgi:hypothetical protein
MKSNAVFNPVLSAVFRKYADSPSGLVGLQLAPVFRTAEQAAKYPVFPRSNATNIPELKGRAPGTPFPRSVPQLSGDTYACVNYGHETPVPDETRKKYAKQIDADNAAIRRNAMTILVNHERRVHKQITTNADILHASPTVKWDAFANAASDPVGDVKAAMAVVRLESGLEPNLITLPRLVIDKLALHPKVRAFFPTYNGTITAEMLRGLFEIERVAIAGAVQNIAADGQAESLGYLWGDTVVISHSEDTPDLEAPNALRTFVWAEPGESGGGDVGSYIESYRDDNVKSDIHRSLHHTDEKVTGTGMIYRLDGVLS